MLTRIVIVVVAMCLLGTCELQAQEPPRDSELEYPECACQADGLVVSRSDYHEKLQGFWLGQCIANWTGLRTEGLKKTAPFFMDKAWGTNQGRKKQKIEFVLVEERGVWGADDDTDNVPLSIRPTEKSRVFNMVPGLEAIPIIARLVPQPGTQQPVESIQCCISVLNQSGSDVSTATDSVRPPAGRLAIVADGNSPDPDDIGATAMMLGLLHASKLKHRLVHLSHSCDLKPSARISAANELRRQKVLNEVCNYGITKYGPFPNLAGYFNCRTDQEAAVDDLRAAINESSDSDPLWIIEAGEPDIIGYALQAADADKRKHVHVVSHHPANDNAGDFFSWQEILDFGVTEHQIGDQNVGLKTAIPPWDWAKEHADERINWIWDQLAYAERDEVVKFQKGHFDCSDAGMVYWWITGADQGGNKHATPSDLKVILSDRKINE